MPVARDEFDIGPLSWVKPEIELALRRADEGIRRFSVSPGDQEIARSTLAHLHQVSGALLMVGLEPVARVSEALEKQIELLARDDLKATPEIMGSIRGAIAALSQYLEGLMRGDPNRPLTLFPVYKTILAASGTEASEVDLFYPDLSRRPKFSESASSRVTGAELTTLLNLKRAEFQRGLLGLLRGKDHKHSLQLMRNALATIEATQTAGARMLWWIAVGLIDGLASSPDLLDTAHKQLCSRIDQQIKRQADGADTVSERLIRELLFAIAKMAPNSARVREIQDTYYLIGLLPPAAKDSPEDTRAKHALRELKEQLEHIKETWLKFTSGNRSSLTQFVEETARLSVLSQGFNNDALQAVFEKLGEVASNLQANPREPGEALSLETATALLMAKDAVDNYSRLGPDFKSLAETAVVRVAAALKGQSLPVEGASQLADISRVAQERMLFFQLGQEVLANLNQIEQALDAYFREPAKRANLADLPASINQVLGAFSMLESEDAVNLLKASRDLVQKFIDIDGAADPHDAELTAEAFSNLGLYVSALQQSRENADELLHPVLARFNIAPSRPIIEPEPEAAEEEAPHPLSTEEDLENRKHGIADLYELWRREPQAVGHRGALVDALFTFRNEAQSIDRIDLVDQVSRLHAIVADPSSQPGPVLRDAFVALLGEGLVREPEPAVEPPQQAQPQPQPQVTKPVGVVEPAATEIDAELLEIFLEEATEVLGGIAIHRDVILANPSDREAMTVIRRGFHTLKGSGRMVGLTELGEVAWQVEQVMNKWLRDEKPASKGLLRLIGDTHHSFVGWVEVLKSGGNPTIQAESVFRLADQLKNDQEPAEEIEMPATAEDSVETGVESEPIPDSAPVPSVELELTVDSDQGLPAKVVIGDVALDPDFFEIFANEANVHMGTLRRELADLKADPEQHVDHDFMRAAHTLTGICRTCGFVPIAELGFRLEKWLLDRLDHPTPFTSDDLSMTVTAVEDLGSMVSRVLEHRQFPIPSPLTERLVERLAQVRADREQEVKTALAEDAEALKAMVHGATAETVQFEETEPMSVEADLSVPETEFSLPMEAESLEATEAELQQSIEQELSSLIDVESMELEPSIAVPFEPVLDAESPDLMQAEPIEAEEQDFVEAEPPQLVEAKLPEPEIPAAPQVPKAPTESVVTRAVVSTPTTTHITTPQSASSLDEGGNVETGKERRVIVDDVDEQLLPVFLEEAFDLLPDLGESLRTWRATPSDKAPAALLGRHLHTLKGSARMAGVMRLGELAHVLETRVVSMQSQAQPEEPDFEALEEGFDRFNVALERLKQGERIELLLTAVTTEPVAVEAPTVVAAHAKVINAIAATEAAPAAPAGHSEEADRRAVLRVRADLIDRFVNDAGEISIARSRIEGEMSSFRQGMSELIDNVNRLRGQLREIEIQAESQIQSSIGLQQEVGDTFDPLEFDRFTRMQELTRFMAESVHDFVTLQQSLIKNLDEADAALAAQSRLNRDLQQDLMSVRMVPLGNLSDRLYRVVRQTAKELGKRANLELKGMRTELDRSVLEQIVAPFEHLLRNALSHGIEAPDVRQAAGKSATGEITIDARQQGNEIVLTFSDDGGGINTERVRQKALEQGLLSPDENPDQKALIDYIFMAGFSTASEITQVAGRGVGMDVVKNAIVNLGGRVEVETELGRGTKFIITLPLTLAVTQVLLIRANGTLYAIPAAMVELVQQWKIADVTALREKKEVVWQGNHYPFSSLTHMLGEDEKPSEPRRYFPVLLLRSGAHRAAVEIDSIEGNREIVVKSIGPQLSRLTGIAGATVLGNGQVVLILNPVMLAGRQEGPTVTLTARPKAEVIAKAPLVMVVDDSLTVRKITSRLLLREGYQVVTAKDGVDALQQLQEFVPDVMLLDIEMPRMDGFELTRNVRADERTAGIPIIMITSRTAEKHRNFALELGVNEYLGKPFQEDELLSNVAKYTARETSATS